MGEQPSQETSDAPKPETPKGTSAPKPANKPTNPSLETSDSLPDALKGDKVIKTKVRNMSEVIREKLMQLEDLATMEVLLDVHVRMKKRLESIKKMSSAYSLKVRGHWKTTNPEMHIQGLEGKKINNDEVQITFSVFELDKKGNKKLYTHYADVLLHDGSMIKRATSAEYRIEFEVTERIKTGKPITREVIRLDRVPEAE